MSLRWKIPRKPCPVTTCIEPVRIDRVMCVAHWRTVEPKLRRLNARAYRAWKSNTRDRGAIAALRFANAVCVRNAIKHAKGAA